MWKRVIGEQSLKVKNCKIHNCLNLSWPVCVSPPQVFVCLSLSFCLCPLAVFVFWLYLSMFNLLFVCVFSCTKCTSTHFLCLWWFTSLQLCEYLYFKLRQRNQIPRIQKKLSHFMGFLCFCIFCIFVFSCLFVCQSEEQLQHIQYFCSVEKRQILKKNL